MPVLTMKISDRERIHFRRLISAGELHEVPLDLFRESEIAERRRSHLILVIERKCRQLKIGIPTDLESKSETDLESIRRGLSRRIAESKRPQPEELAA